jgi:hypothetical protein
VPWTKAGSRTFSWRNHQHLSNGLQLGKLREHEPDGVLHAAIRVLLDTVIVGLHITDRHRQKELASPGLLLHGLA